MAGIITKAYEMTDAKISFVSLVNKAANRKQFLITKAENGSASFQTYGRILKADAEAHYVTGIVYEPLKEDTQGNYMTEEEITKAAHWFAKNGNSVDLQHSFEPLEGASVVESWVAKADFDIDGENVKKGTWLMTVEITDNDIFDAIEKGDITGFSMGGVGRYSNQDVSLEEVEKTADPKKKKSMLKSIASKLGFDVVEKGFVKDKFVERVTSEDFWQAFYSLQDALFKWNYHDDRMVIENDPELIKEALTDFNEIVTGLLTAQNIEKSVEAVCKAGKKMSSANKETLKQIYENLGEFVSKFNDEEEEIEVTKSEIQEIVKSAVAECFAEKVGETLVEKACANTVDEKKKKKACAKSAEPVDDETITKADVQKMIDEAIRKATGEEEPEEEEESSMEEVVAKAVSAAMEPFMKQAGLPTNLNNAGVQKADEEQHYMHGYI